ncbi:MAG: ATP-binding protein [Candidatus Bathyarchaeota archaeon]|nr:ATP-binding protein [Candidatus Bathyarchaeota archaeon]
MIHLIKNLKIGNFKSIGVRRGKIKEIELAPLTIFVGPNGSGKSSILQAVAIMAQCVANKVSILNALRGELVDFEDKKNIFWKENEAEPLSLGFESEIIIEDVIKALRKDLAYLRDTFMKSPKRPESPFDRYMNFFFRLYRKFLDKRRTNKTAIGIKYLSTVTADMRSYEHSYSMDDTVIGVKAEKGKPKYTPKELQLIAGGDFLPYFNMVGGLESNFIALPSDHLRSKVSKVYYLSAERGSIPWTYAPSSKAKTWVGKNGEYTLEILTRLMKPEFDAKRLPYELFCERFGIGHAWAGWDRVNALTSNYEDPFLKSSHKFPSLGQGSKQLIPVITQLAYSDSGSIILVEEPEMSLHPAYQRLLPALFGRAVKEGKQILLTTHSSYFPLSLDLVLKGYNLSGQTTRGRKKYRIQLSTDDVLVYHVMRDRRGYTNLEKLEIDENGLKEGIPSFINVEREILGRYMSKE